MKTQKNKQNKTKQKTPKIFHYTTPLAWKAPGKTITSMRLCQIFSQTIFFNNYQN